MKSLVFVVSILAVTFSTACKQEQEVDKINNEPFSETAPVFGTMIEKTVIYEANIH